jgi:hypothetical protein
MDQILGSATYSQTLATDMTKETFDNTLEPDVIAGPNSVPWLDSVEPNTVAVPGPDTTVIFTGGNFFKDVTWLIWAGTPEPAMLIDQNHASTVVKPSTVQAPLPHTLQCWAENSRGVESNRLDFHFVAA